MTRSSERNLSLRKRDVTIFSIFGRGHWIATELVRQLKLKVSLVDLSDSMGHWGPEDWEGPFGLFRSEKLKNSQLERLDEEDHFEPIEQGFIVWLKQGPLELKGSLTPYLLKKSGISSITKKYLKEHPELNLKEKKAILQHMISQPFKKIWLAHLAHQMTSNIYRPHSCSLEEGEPLPLLSPYYRRQVSRRGYYRSLKWCENQGVEVFSHARLKNIKPRKFLDTRYEKIKITNEKKQIKNLLSLSCLWMLSGEESLFLNPNFSKIFYPRGTLKSTWAWIHFRARLKGDSYLQALPMKFILIEDLNLPWTHNNLCFVEKILHTDFNIWIRIPIQNRFEKKYLENLCQGCLGNLKNRIAAKKVSILNMPQEYIYKPEELGPPRYPIYSLEGARSFKHRLQRKLRFRNIYLDGPEHWKRLDWLAQFESQNILFQTIKTWLEKRKALNKNSLNQNLTTSYKREELSL